MKLIFHIDYRANWGESLYVSADIPALGNGKHADALKMEIDGDRSWHAELELPDGIQAFRYKYIVRNEGGDVKLEWGDSHLFEPFAGVHEYDLFDRWPSTHGLSQSVSSDTTKANAPIYCQAQTAWCSMLRHLLFPQTAHLPSAARPMSWGLGIRKRQSA